VIAVGEHNTTRGLGNEVTAPVATVHARLPKGRDGDIDEPWMQPEQVFIAKPIPRQLAWLPIFYQHIGTHSEGAQPLSVRLMREIERHALLATVQIGEGEAVVRLVCGSKIWLLPAAWVTL
jgi:hypothetical protein